MAQTAVPPLDTAKIPALSGVNAPVTDERDTGPLEVTGRLPDDLHGVYLRNGPNPRFPPVGSYDYPFDGDAMVHGVWFDGDSARYRNRFVQTAEMRAEEQAGRALWGGMLSGVGPDPADIPASLNPHQKVRPMINVLAHAGRYFACAEAQPWYEIDAGLGTVGPASFGADPPRLCAHPKIDAATGEMILFNYQLLEPPYFSWGIVGSDGHLSRMNAVEEIDVPLMVHDFVITERHAVFFFNPVVFDILGRFGAKEPISWQPDRGTRIAVVPRDGSKPTWFDTDAFWVWHYANAFDDGNTVVVDMPLWGSFDVEATAGIVTIKRCRLDLATGRVTFDDVDDHVAEFPRVDDRYVGQRQRAFIASAWSGDGTLDGDFYDTLLRVEPDTGKVQAHRFGTGGIGEAIFAPRDGGASGDGYVVTYVFIPGEPTTDLLVLDASDIAAAPIATVHLPFRVPTGLHGSWVAAT